MAGPVSAANARADPQKALSTTHWARTGSCSTRISRVGPPCWECRASSVWIEEIMLAKLTSPDASASAASATNCRLVNPVSKVSGSSMAMSTTFAEVIMASNRLRSEIATQSLVWNVFCVQSYWASLPTNSCPKNVVTAAGPEPVDRPEGGQVPPRAVQPETRHLKLGQHGGVLDQGDAAEVHLGRGLPALGQAVERGRALQRGLHRVYRRLLLPLGRDVFRVADLVALLPGLTGLPGHLAGAAVPLGVDGLVVDVAVGPVHVPDEALPLFPLEQCHRMGPLVSRLRCGRVAG